MERLDLTSNGVEQSVSPLLEQDEDSPTGIKFSEEDDARAMDILLDFGPAQAFPDCVYITNDGQVRRAAVRLQQAGIVFQINRNIPGRLTLDEARSLKDREGWVPYVENRHAEPIAN